MLKVRDIILCISTTNYYLSLPAYSCCSQRGPSTPLRRAKTRSTAPNFHFFVSHLVPISKLSFGLLKDTSVSTTNTRCKSSKISLRKSRPTMSFSILANNPLIFYMHTKKNASHYTKIKKLDTIAPQLYPPLCPVRALLLTPTSGTSHRLCLKSFASHHAWLMGHFSFSCTAPMHNV